MKAIKQTLDYLCLRQSLALASFLVCLLAAHAATGVSGQEVKATIAQAREYALQKERLRACALLARARAKQVRGSVAFRELTVALDDLSQVFFTEQGQGAWSLAESLAEAKPPEAIEAYLAALKGEDGNVAALKGLARAYLALSDCERAEATVVQAELASPQAAELRLLRLQILDCQKNDALLDARLTERDPDLEPVEKFAKSLQAKALFRKKEIKKGRALVALWETLLPENPEALFWKWRFSVLSGEPDRPAAVRYVQACQSLTPRKQKLLHLDMDLCKGRPVVEVYLKTAGLQPSSPSEGPPND